MFLRALTTLLAAAQAAFDRNAPASQPGEDPADPYMTALCYFNALRELGGARRIVEDEVRDRVGRYGMINAAEFTQGCGEVIRADG